MERGRGRSSVVSGPAILAAVLDAAVDARARPVGAAVSVPAAYGVYPLIILIVYVIVTGGILCSDLSGRSLLLGTQLDWEKRLRTTGLTGFDIWRELLKFRPERPV